MADKYIRRNVYDIDHGAIKDGNTLFWYARGVRELNKRPLDNKLSWRYYAAIHGFNKVLWSNYGYLLPGEPIPPNSDFYWNQCQHASWYFFPWHRGYLLGIEATLRDAIVKLGGPKTWAMPYWNYFAKDQYKLPEAFAEQTAYLGDADPRNPLFIERRWGPDPQEPGNVYVPMNDSKINLDALDEPDFAGRSDGGSTGFGGPVTEFSHSGGAFGQLEQSPHNPVHTKVGGEHDGRGLMGDPRTAGLDPIFWLHHANIDRLWEVWLRRSASHVNPTETNWLNGPVPPAPAPRSPKFIMPTPKGDWTFTPGDVANLAQLDYTYDDLTLAGVSPMVLEQMERVSAPFARAASAGGTAMAASRNVELVGASRTGLRIAGAAPVRAPVQLDGDVRRKVLRNVRAEAAAAAPERVFLNLENVRGLRDSTTLDVYVNLPEDADPAEHPERLAGSAALFGVTEATTSEEHGGNGLTFVFEITHMVDALELDTNALDVRIVPFHDVPEEAQISIGRVSVFRQGS